MAVPTSAEADGPRRSTRRAAAVATAAVAAASSSSSSSASAATTSRVKAMLAATPDSLPPPVFDGLVFSISAKALRMHPSLDVDIRSHAGVVKTSIAPAVRYIIALADEYTDRLIGKVKSAVANNIPVVHPNFIVESLKGGKLLDIDAYLIGKQGSASGSSGGKAAKSAVKEFDDPEEEYDPPVAPVPVKTETRGRKRKVVAGAAVSDVVAASAAADAANGKPKRSKKGLAAPEESAPVATDPQSAAESALIASKTRSRNKGKGKATDFADAVSDTSVGAAAVSADSRTKTPAAASKSAMKTNQISETNKENKKTTRKQQKAAPKLEKKGERIEGKAIANVDNKDDRDEDRDEDHDDKKIVKLIKKGRSVVDEHCPVAQKTHVVESKADIFDVMLNQTEIKTNNNKFYIIQLLKDDAGPQHYVWMRWGRVGLVGQSKLAPFDNFQEAFIVFSEKFSAKTGNQWEDRDNFEKRAGKYDLIERDFGEDGDADGGKGDAAAKPTEPVKIPDSKLLPQVRSLMELIFNIDMMNRQMMEIGYDAKKMPLGKLSKANILKGYEVLKQIADVIENSPAIKGVHAARIMELSSRFYTIVPHVFGMSRPPPIDTMPTLKKKLEMVEALADIEIATNLIRSAAGHVEEHPLDFNYHSLKCDIFPVNRDSATFKMVQEYSARTHGYTHGSYGLKVLDVFEVARQGEQERFVKSGSAQLPNHMLLWHGSRLTNFVGILSQGLRIAPPEAPSTGYMFGKGVYFADMVSKSANYCCTSRKSNTGILLLCEVALGSCKELLQADYHADQLVDMKTHHSTKGLGRTVPNGADYTKLDDGTVVPMGKSVDQDIPGGYLQYNEYIVYSTDQVRIRYLVKMEFEYRA